MAAAVKPEPMEDTDLETRVKLLCQENPDGITDAMIQTDKPQFDVKQRVTAINRLLSTGKIDLLKNSSGKLIYKLKDTGAHDAVKGSDQQEKVIYQIIKDAGNKGIWIRDIRFRSNLSLTQVNKILKNLESKKLIKAVKSVAASKKKVYMLYNLEPDRTVTGGAWYSDQDFESEFVEVLNQQCYKFLVQKSEATKESLVDPIAQLNGSFVSSKDVWKFISELGISKVKHMLGETSVFDAILENNTHLVTIVQLSVEDIETILDTLIYDGKVERSIMATAEGQNKLYRAIHQLVEPTGLMRMPCGSCPVFSKCYDGGAVSPKTCVYMKEWLQL